MRKLLIANRGEIAVRIARTARAMGLGTVTVYSEPDARAPHVHAGDEAIALGGATPGESYLRGGAIIDAAQRTGADAVHPGYGFLAENASFAQQVVDADLTWVGPHPDAIARMGDKLEAKAIMTDAGVPILPSAVLDDDVDLDAAGQDIGFPLLVKAAAGGGGKGMRVVRDPAELADAVGAARREAAGAFGDDRVFLERFMERPRHVEIQILGDRHGNIVHLFERECSIQRRHQKVVEETPSPALTPQLRKAMGDAAIAAGRAIGYDNAGTVEFVLGGRSEDGAEREFAFLEVNTRLQVEHPVTEMVVTHRGGQPLDLVRLQLLVARGERLPFAQEDVVQRGHAIEVRLYAEDPANDYLPATGRLHGFAPASGVAAEGGQVRWDTGVAPGQDVSPHYDPMLAKVIAHAPTRDEAAGRLARELRGSLVHGVTTNRDLLVAILEDHAFLAGDTTTAFLEERFTDPEDRTFVPGAPALRSAAIVAAFAQIDAREERPRQLSTLPSGWRNNRAHDQRVRFRHAEHEIEVHYRQTRDGQWKVEVDGQASTVRRFGNLDLEIDGHRLAARVSRAEDPVAGQRELHVVLPDAHVTLGEIARFPRAGLVDVPGAALAPMPGAVVSVAVEKGDAVEAGDLLVTLEAMKMEHRVTAPHDGTVAEIHVEAGSQVDADAVLVVIEEE